MSEPQQPPYPHQHWQQPHYYPPQPLPAPEPEVIDRGQRRAERRPSPLSEFLSRTSASFIGTLFGSIFAGLVLLLVVRAYIHWSIKSTAEEWNKAMEEERLKNPPPTFPRFEWPTPPTGKAPGR